MKVGDLVKPSGEFFEWRNHFGIVVEEAGQLEDERQRGRYRIQWCDKDYAHKHYNEWWDDFQLEVVHESEV